MRLLITGGAGFLGSHLAEHFLGQGHEVLVLDNYITGRPENIRALLPHPYFTFIKQDVTEYIEVPGRLDAVFHFASPASPIDYAQYPIQTLKAGALGTHKTLGLAKDKRAVYVLASTSEVYGDPLVSPQPESYWGNVNPIGPRGVYDEAKRFAEAMAMAYHRTHRVKVRIARIFNSILADETVILCNDDHLHLEPVERYAASVRKRLDPRPPKVLVPSFDPETCRVVLSEASDLIQHPCHSDCFQLSLRYGRRVRVTGDHSVFVSGPGGRPLAVPVRDLKAGDHVAIPGRLPVHERDLRRIDLVGQLLQRIPRSELWDYAVQSPSLKPVIAARREAIHSILARSGRFKARRRRNALVCASAKYLRESLLPLHVLQRLGLDAPADGRLRLFKAGAHIWLPSTIEVSDDILWLAGFFIAEGSSHLRAGKSAFLTFSSDEEFLEKARSILSRLGCHTVKTGATRQRAPALFVHSRLLYFLFDQVFGLLRGKQFPAWVLQLPLSRLKHVLEGYRQGDGTHSGKKVGRELCFDTTSPELADSLLYLLLRFGVVGSFGRYETSFKKRYGKRRFPFYRITVCEVDPFDVLAWDRGVRQTLNARRTGDLVWSMIKDIRRCAPTPYVYDFSVPGKENFVAGNGVFCHNTYGPRMRKNDGRAVPNFITQALANKPITVYGKGRQTRSLCFVSDLVRGLDRLLHCGATGPVNLGNPDEHSMLDIARLIKRLAGSKSAVVFKPLPVDDPKVRRPDISLARRLLKWKPEVGLDEGLGRTLDYFRG